jgi:hypothetical protein
LLATVDVVAKEQIVGLWRKATILEKSEQIVVLSVDVTADLRLASVARSGVKDKFVARTFIGASSSNRIGWEMKISRALVQRYRISASSSWTCLPGLLPRTSSRRSIMESKSTSF